MKRAALLAALVLCGCQYYRVRDIPTGKEYVTNNWQMSQNWNNGSIKLNDLKTGKLVVLQNYEEEAIPADQAKQEISTRRD